MYIRGNSIKWGEGNQLYKYLPRHDFGRNGNFALMSRIENE